MYLIQVWGVGMRIAGDLETVWSLGGAADRCIAPGVERQNEKKVTGYQGQVL
jgi:hypothetical protein